MSPTVRLDELCKIQSGGTPRRDQTHFYGGSIPWAKISDLETEDGVVTSTEEHITEYGLEAIGNRLVPPGTVLLAMYGSVGKVAVAGVPLSTNQAILGIQIAETSRLDSGYLLHWLDSIQHQLVLSANGVTQKNISATAVRALRIPLPPLAEQRRIAALLNRADAVRRKREESRQLVDELLRSVFLEMFGDPVRNEKGWEVKRVGDVCRVLGGKRLPKGSSYSEVPTPYRYIRATDITHGRVDELNLRYLTPEVQAHITRYTVTEGDVVITIAGTIGEVAPIPAAIGGANLTENAAKLCPVESDSYHPRFLADLLRDPGVKSSLLAETGQVTIQKLALFRIERVTIPVPPINLQRVYAERVRGIDRLRERVMTATAATGNLGAQVQNQLYGSDETVSRS